MKKEWNFNGIAFWMFVLTACYCFYGIHGVGWASVVAASIFFVNVVTQ